MTAARDSKSRFCLGGSDSIWIASNVLTPRKIVQTRGKRRTRDAQAINVHLNRRPSLSLSRSLVFPCFGLTFSTKCTRGTGTVVSVVVYTERAARQGKGKETTHKSALFKMYFLRRLLPSHLPTHVAFLAQLEEKLDLQA